MIKHPISQNIFDYGNDNDYDNDSNSDSDPNAERTRISLQDVDERSWSSVPASLRLAFARRKARMLPATPPPLHIRPHQSWKDGIALADPTELEERGRVAQGKRETPTRKSAGSATPAYVAADSDSDSEDGPNRSFMLLD